MNNLTEKNNDITVVFFDNLLGNNEFITKSICILLYYNATDIIFIQEKENIKIKLKSIKNDLDNINYNLNIKTKDFNQMKINLKLSCNLNIIENNIPQTGQFNIMVNNKNFSIRCAFHPTNHGESLCMRIINSNIFSNIDNIANKIKKGLNIIGGRTCSGKTTLMYSSIINFKGHVITLEDPVEFILDNISQTDVSIMGYEEGIKSALRQHPDLICIGEIRDSISAKSAVKAALTGHSVLATIHINSPENLLYRLKDLNCQFFEEVLNNIFFMNDFIREDYIFKNNSIYRDIEV